MPDPQDSIMDKTYSIYHLNTGTQEKSKGKSNVLKYKRSGGEVAQEKT